MEGQENLKRKTLSGVAWKFAERIAAQGVTTIVSIILARILEPSHYGVISLVNVFITICNVFVVTGLGESLIQKKDADELDFSSIFYINVGLSIALYALLFFAAPAISNFYNNQYPQLILIIRVMGVRLIFAAINSIQSAKISREMNFRKYFWATLIGTAISAIVGMYMAVSGYGVWALVAQYMTGTIINTITLFVFDGWIPKLQFSTKRAVLLFKYGWKVLASALIGTLYNECSELIIGKKYSTKDLAFYSKGQTYPKLVANNLNNAIASVMLPLFSKIQDDADVTKKALSRALKTTSYLIFPTMVGFSMVAEPFIRLLLTEKWLPAVPYMRILCIIYAILPLSMTNLQCLNAHGYSNIYLKVGFIKNFFGIIVLFCVFRFGVIWVALSHLITTIINYIVDASVTQKYIRYKLWHQFKDISLNLLTTLLMALSLYGSRFVLTGLSDIIYLILQIIIGASVYILFSVIFKNDSFFYFLATIKKFFKKG